MPPQRDLEASIPAHPHFRNGPGPRHPPCNSAKSMHPLQSAVPLHGPIFIEGSFEICFFLRKIYLMYTPAASLRSVSERGQRHLSHHGRARGYGIPGPSGRPAFIRLRKPRSFTILKGRLLSDAQRTISALHLQ